AMRLSASCGHHGHRRQWPLHRDGARAGTPERRFRSGACGRYRRACGDFMTLAQRDYIRDGDEIYRRSFAIIRAEADLSRFTPAEERAAVRIIHACGMPEIARDIVFHPDFAIAASEALKAGAPVLCDSKMVANGITL